MVNICMQALGFFSKHGRSECYLDWILMNISVYHSIYCVYHGVSFSSIAQTDFVWSVSTILVEIIARNVYLVSMVTPPTRSRATAKVSGFIFVKIILLVHWKMIVPGLESSIIWLFGFSVFWTAMLNSYNISKYQRPYFGCFQFTAWSIEYNRLWLSLDLLWDEYLSGQYFLPATCT